MKKLLGMSVLGMALALAGCGGDSDSSGHDNQTNAKKETPAKTKPAETKPTTPTTSECKSDGNTVYATAQGCTYSISNFNGGTPQTYVCTGSGVTSGGLSAKTINLNGITIVCAK